MTSSDMVTMRETAHSMTRRRNGWDYREKADYMVTLTLADRSRGWLGRLETREQAHGHYGITRTQLGEILAEKWWEIPSMWPGVEARDFVVMPEHFHGIIRVTTRQEHPLGHIIGAFKARTTSAARELGCNQSTAMVPPSLLDGKSLWAEGYTDSILWGRGRYERAAAYIADNPRRLAVRLANPQLFTVRRDITVPLEIDGPITAHFSAVGNDALLSRIDFHQVQCSRSFFAYAKDQYGKQLKNETPAVITDEFREILDDALAAAREGAVLVNPCISQGEREIARRAFASGAPIIVLKNQGFSPQFKPVGELFDRCMEGKILMLAPAAWSFTNAKKQMTREDACAINRIAQAIAHDGAAVIDYKGREPRFISADAIRAVSSPICTK